MGLFSWLFGSAPRVPVVDRIWLTDAARLRGIRRDLDHHRHSGPILVLAHFRDSLNAVRSDLDTHSVPHAPLPPGQTPPQHLRTVGTGGGLIFTGLARDLRASEFPEPEPASGVALPILVAERHPLRKYDDAVVQFAEQLGGGEPVAFHSSLDDPLMRLFAGDWVKNVLRQLGAGENDAIESAMVARRIKAAQDKVAKRVEVEREADSAAAWLQANLGGG